MAFSVTRDPLYSNEIERQLVSWTVQNPILVGVNWYSGLELALRLDSWVWIERLLRGSDAHRSLFSTSGVLWQPIYWHQRIIHQTLSPGSSSNNHLIGELTGLFVAASAWPVFPESEHWAEDARDRLETEIDRQTYASGLNRELAFSYHLFVLELFLTAAIEGRRSGRDFSPAYLNRLRDMRETIVALADKRGNLPRFGDEDGGTALALLAPQADHARTLLDLSERFLLGTEWQSRGLERRLIDQVMLGALPASARVSTAVEQDRDFSDAGVYTLSSERGTEEEILVIADAGPLGYLSIAAHGHADALSFTLNAGGHPVLVDPGTYTYFGDADARSYFRSTAAHNTIVVDGLDQSESGGPFIWTKKASARVLEWRRDEAGATLLAEHDGYKRLAGEVTHRRRLDLIDNTLTVEDRLDGRGSHEIEWRLHFHPSCVVTVEDGVCLASWEHGGLTFRCDPRLDWRLASGEADAGWYSSAFNERSTSTTLIGSSSVDLPFELSHALCVSFCR